MKRKLILKIPDQLWYEEKLWKKGTELIAGVDESGRGPLAGPVVAAAVIFPPKIQLEGIKDSKKLLPPKREELFEKIFNSALSVGMGIVDEKEIDQINILNASLEAMRLAVLDLNIVPEFVLVDGNRKIPDLNIPQLPLIGGDSLSLFVASASIVAKVTRDRLMLKYHKTYPQFCFAQNKGYCTKSHVKALKDYGPCKIHRCSFHPVKFLKNRQEPSRLKSYKA